MPGARKTVAPSAEVSSTVVSGLGSASCSELLEAESAVSVAARVLRGGTCASAGRPAARTVRLREGGGLAVVLTVPPFSEAAGGGRGRGHADLAVPCRRRCCLVVSCFSCTRGAFGTVRGLVVEHPGGLPSESPGAPRPVGRSAASRKLSSLYRRRRHLGATGAKSCGCAHVPRSGTAHPGGPVVDTDGCDALSWRSLASRPVEPVLVV